MRAVLGIALMFALWLLMSGIYNSFVIGLGAGSSIFVGLMVWRMEQASKGARIRIQLKPIAFIGYLIWLMKEIAKANWAVTKAIMGTDLAMRRHFFLVPFTQKTEVMQTTYANSITLTPGTLTVELEEGSFWVHALDYGDTTMDELADMDARITATEAA